MNEPETPDEQDDRQRGTQPFFGALCELLSLAQASQARRRNMNRRAPVSTAAPKRETWRCNVVNVSTMRVPKAIEVATRYRVKSWLLRRTRALPTCQVSGPTFTSRTNPPLGSRRFWSSTPPRHLAHVPRSRSELLAALPAGYPHDLVEDIQRDEATVGRIVVVLDDDPTGTQMVHNVPVLAEWSVDALAKELASPGKYRVVYLNTNSRALNPKEAFSQYEQIARNLKEACAVTGIEVTVVSRGDSTLRGHFPGDLLALEKGLGVTHDAWILAPFFQAGGRITAGDIHFVETPGTKAPSTPGQENLSTTLTPAGETEFSRDAAFGYKSSNLIDWIKEKSAADAGGQVSGSSDFGGKSLGSKERTEKVVSVSLRDLREGGPQAVRARLREARGGCVVVNSVERRDLQVFVKGLLEEELDGKRFLFRTAADFVAVRGAVGPRPLLERGDFDVLRAASLEGGEVVGSEGGLTVVGSYVAKTTEQLKYALDNTSAVGVELRAVEVVGDGDTGKAAFDREVDRLRREVSRELSRGHDVILYTTRGVPLQADGAGGLVYGERVGAALVDCVAGLKERPRFLVSKGGITSSDVATKALGMTRAEVMGQILPGVPVWSMPRGSRWPGLPLIVFPGNVGGKDGLVEAMVKLGAKTNTRNEGHKQTPAAAAKSAATTASTEAMYPYASGSGSGSRTLDILSEARARGAAVGAFTVYNLEGIRAVVEAAEATGRSAILQAHPAALGFQRGVPLLSAAVKAARICTAAGGPLLSVQLDHGDSEDHVSAALEAGVDSVMIDGSAMEYDQNVKWTANLAAKAHDKGAAVEAELGRLAGEEDGLCISEVEAKMTDPDVVPDFLERTRANILAVTVGNVHGKYSKLDPKLDLSRLELIQDASASFSPCLKAESGGGMTSLGGDYSVGGEGGVQKQGILLALHGASGLPSSQIRGSIDRGVCKFNVNTEVRTAAVEFLLREGRRNASNEANRGRSDYLGVLNGSVGAMRAVVEQKMREFDPR